MSKEKVEKAKEVIISPAQQLQALLNANNKDHYDNHVQEPEEEKGYKISTGSLKLDIELSGGLDAGAHRFIGVREGGKTSAALEVAKNFQLKFKNHIQINLY